MNLPRSIQTNQQFEAERAAWNTFQQARLAGIPVMQQAGGEPPPPKPPDDYTERLAKYIPAEVITLYPALVAAASQAVGNPPSAEWLKKHLGDGWLPDLNLAAFVVGLCATPADLWFRQNVRSVGHILISTGSFAVWALAIADGLFKDWPPVVRGFVLPVYTFLVARYKPTPNADGKT